MKGLKVRIEDLLSPLCAAVAACLLLCVTEGCRRAASGASDSAGERSLYSMQGDDNPVEGQLNIPLTRSEWAGSLRRFPADSLFNLGTDYALNLPVRPDSALVCYLTATSREDTTRDRDELLEIAKCYVNEAHVYATVYHRPASAFKCLQQAEKLCKAHGFDKVLAFVYLNMGTNIDNEEKLRSDFKPGQESEKSFRYLALAYDTAEEAGSYEAMGYSLYNMLSVESPSPEVRKYMERYLKADIPDTDLVRPYVSTVCRGCLSFMNGDYEEAHRQFAAADTVCHADEAMLPRFREYVSFMDGMAYEESGDTDRARSIYESILEDACAREDLEFALWMEGNLYLYHTRHGNKPQAESHLLNYYRTRERIAQAADSISISDLQTQEQIKGYEQELAKARKPKPMPLWLRILIISSGCLILALAVGLLLYRRRLRYVRAMYEKFIKERDEAPQLPVERAPAPAPEETEKPAADLPDPELVRRIAEVLDRSDEVFDPEFQMVRLCAMVGSNSTYVSKAVNAHYGKPFKTVLAERRVREACRRLDNPQTNATLTIEAIGNEVGFKSRTAFSIAFKNLLGITPTEYRKATRRYMPT